MSKKQLVLLSYLVAIICAINFISCSKENAGRNTNIPPVINDTTCKVFIVTASATAAQPCGSGGSIQITATGSNAFTYKLNINDTFQQSPNFSNVVPGTYTVFIKDSAGCQQSVGVTVSTATAGPKFAAVKNLIAAACQSCHNASTQNGGIALDNQCNIIDNGLGIQSQVNFEEMPFGGPPLSQSQKDIINNWISAGGGYAN